MKALPSPSNRMKKVNIMARYDKSLELFERASKVIPLASQTFSKSITQFPKGVSPLFIEKGDGSHVWDYDGNEYIDFGSALLSVSIGYNDPDVIKAVSEKILTGVSYSLPNILETEVAEMLVDMVPCAEKVRFGKNGSDSTSGAIRIARAYTKKVHVLVCGYHGWQDWYIGSTARHLGVPEAVRALTHSFTYNDIDSLEKLLNDYKDQVAAVIMEPMNIEYPKEGFLEKCKELAHQHGALFVFDETITGCRFAKGGAQELFGVTPDLATFGKGLGNGFPLSALVGKAKYMDLMNDIFFSGTFGGETASLAAAKVVLQKVKNTTLVEDLTRKGTAIMDGVNTLITKHKLESVLAISGHPSWSLFTFKDTPDYGAWDIKTYFMQEVYKRGIITIGSHNVNASHSEEDILTLLSVYDEVFAMIGQALTNKNLADMLECEPLVPLFKVR